jgi:transposase-like protein
VPEDRSSREEVRRPAQQACRGRLRRDNRSQATSDTQALFLPNQIDQAARQHHFHLARRHWALGLLPTAAGFDSFWDSQIGETLTRFDLTAKELRAAAGREKNGSAARRMLALTMVLDGADRKSAAESCGMDRQILRDWVHRYNAEGLRSLHDLTTPEVPSPDPARHGVVRWRRVDLRDVGTTVRLRAARTLGR